MSFPTRTITKLVFLKGELKFHESDVTEAICPIWDKESQSLIKFEYIRAMD